MEQINIILKVDRERRLEEVKKVEEEVKKSRRLTTNKKKKLIIFLVAFHFLKVIYKK